MISRLQVKRTPFLVILLMLCRLQRCQSHQVDQATLLRGLRGPGGAAAVSQLDLSMHLLEQIFQLRAIVIMRLAGMPTMPGLAKALEPVVILDAAAMVGLGETMKVAVMLEVSTIV